MEIGKISVSPLIFEKNKNQLATKYAPTLNLSLM